MFHYIYKVHPVGKCNKNIVAILDHRAFELSQKKQQTFMIKSMDLRAINRIIHYGKDVGNREALIDLKDDDPITERSVWYAVIQDGCYGIFRPTTPAPSTTNTTSFTKITG